VNTSYVLKLMQSSKTSHNKLNYENSVDILIMVCTVVLKQLEFVGFINEGVVSWIIIKHKNDTHDNNMWRYSGKLGGTVAP